MKWNRLLTPIGVLLFLALCLVPSGQAQSPSYAAGVPYQLGVGFNFTSASTQTGAFNTGGILYYTLVWVPTGTVSGCTLTVDGATASGGSFSTGSLVGSQTCTSAGSFTTSSATFSVFGKITPTVTGSGSVSVFLFGYINNPIGGGGASTNVAVTNFPATQNTQDASTGATGSAVPAKAAYLGGSNGGTMVGITADSLGDLHVALENAIPAGTNLIGQIGSNMTGTTPGTAPGFTDIVGCINNTAAPGPSNGQTLPCQADAAGSLYIAFRSSTNGCASNNGAMNSIALNASTTSLTQIIALSAGKKIYVCAAYIQGGGTTPTLSLEYGTGTNCATGTTVLTQAVALTTAAPGISWPGPGPVVPAGNALCYVLTGTSPTAVGWIAYVQ